MENVVKGGNDGRSGIVKRLGPLVVMSALFAGCTGYERISQQPVDEKYTVLGLNWTSGDSTVIVLKAYEADGQLAMCGSRTATRGSDVHVQLEQQFFNRSNVVIEDVNVGPLAFVSSVPRSGLEVKEEMDRYVVTQWSGKANCVRTKTPWKKSYQEKNISFEGPERVRGRF